MSCISFLWSGRLPPPAMSVAEKKKKKKDARWAMAILGAGEILALVKF